MPAAQGCHRPVPAPGAGDPPQGSSPAAAAGMGDGGIGIPWKGASDKIKGEKMELQ